MAPISNLSNFLLDMEVQLADPKVKSYLSSNRISWSFIPAFSPWYGGAYERMVGIVKSCLQKALSAHGSTLVDFVTL